jgi:uracil-DNA glycosylase
MFAALKKDYLGFTPPPQNGGLLTPWAEQGVLLLNTCLTVRAHEANSHSNQGWERFTQKVIDTVVKVRTRGVVFLAWGSPAQKRCAKITGTKHLVLKSVHPSPLSAHKGFFDCGHFRRTNEWLRERYGEGGEIDWALNGKGKGGGKEEMVKVLAQQKPVVGSGKTEVKLSVEKENVKVSATGMKKKGFEDDEFGIDEDEDALAALEELAQSSAADAGEGAMRSQTVKGSQD